MSGDPTVPVQGAPTPDDSNDQMRCLLAALIVLDIRHTATAEAIAASITTTGTLELLHATEQLRVVGDRITLGNGGSMGDRERGTTAISPATLERATLAAVARTTRAGDLSEAGRIAVAGGSADAVRAVLRSALIVQPPAVTAHDLRSWRDAEVLDASDPYEWWLDATCRSLLSGPSAAVFDRFEQARRAFADQGDAETEIAVGMSAAIVARRLDDIGALVAFITRAGELAEQGCHAAAASARLGRALVQQMSGNPTGALAELETVPPDSFEGDWAAQLSMMRGTNLLLLDRLDEALAHMTAATGTGGNWSYSVALELSATVRWRLDDRVGAIHDLEVAEATALKVGAPLDADRIRSQRLAMLALDSDPSAEPLVLASLAGLVRDDESERVLRVAHVIASVEAGDLERARTLAAPLDAPNRALRSTQWIIPVQVALMTESFTRWAPVAAAHRALQAPLEAGVVAAAHLGGGPLAPRSARPYLPASWCEPVEPVIELQLLGGATVLRNRQIVREPSWERSRVRELCCYLALVENSARSQAAARLWPDLSTAAGARNLRVTLSYLLDVLDPQRERSEGSNLITEQGGIIRLARTDRLRIDLREMMAHCAAMLRAAQAGDNHLLLREARLLVRLPSGAILGGSAVGAWLEAHEQARRELILRAVSAASPVVLRAGDTELAEDLARRGLAEDPWAERLHQMVARACLARDDLDAARRAVFRALEMIAELEVQPERATLDLARQVGIENLTTR